MFTEILQYGLYAVKFNPGAESIPYYLVAILAVLGYLLGSINSAVLVSRTLYREDIRTKGSGNAGLTNMFRIYGKKAAGLTLLGDILKTVLAIVIAGLFCGFRYRAALSFSPMCWIAALACVIGHIKPVFHHFRGGKGVLCAATAILFLASPVFLVLFIAFILIVWATRYISLGSITVGAFLPLALQGYMQAFIFSGDEKNFFDGGIVIFGVLFGLLIVICHRKNIGRLWRREENKFSFHRTKDASDGK